MSKFIDLSHTIEAGMITYKGLPAPVICDFLSREKSRDFYEAGTEFQIGKIEMVTNTGTYLDCPFHRYAHGHDLSEILPEQFADLAGITIRHDLSQGLAIDVAAFTRQDVRGRAVLVHTDWARHWRTDQYFEDHPFLTADAAAYLVEQGATLVGIDSHNIDDTRGRTRPVHTTLLGANILIVEHLCNLDQLPNNGFTFSAIPPKVKGAGTFPVRALAKLK
ncbi:MAG: cyclase family protein [Caldilineaceae bacterium]